MRAVLYLRLSSTTEDSTSIARQKQDLRHHAEREGWEIVRTLTDDGISGTKDRANADEALRMLRDREADVLAVWKLDRWSRQGVRAVGDLVETLDSTPGALFVALRDGIRSDQAAWRLTAAVLSEVARTEAENTSVRVRSAIAHRRQIGKFPGGTVPFGYRSAPHPGGGRTLVPFPPEVAIIEEVAERILGEETQASILHDLTSRGVPTTRSEYRWAQIGGRDAEGLDRGSWSYAGLAAVWTGDSLLGRISRSRPVVGEDGKTRKAWETVTGTDGLPLAAFPPLLDFATVERLRGFLRDPRRPRTRRGPRRERAARLLSGVIYCADCGQRLWVTTSGGRSVYTCAVRAGRCAGPNMKVEHAERAVEESFLRTAGSGREVEQIEEVTAPDTVAALREIESAIREQTESLAADDADGTAVLRRIEALKVRRSELRAQPSSIKVRTVETGRSVAEAWEQSSTAERRAMLGAVLDHVELSRTTRKGQTGYHPDRIALVWREPSEDFDAA